MSNDLQEVRDSARWRFGQREPLCQCLRDDVVEGLQDECCGWSNRERCVGVGRQRLGHTGP